MATLKKKIQAAKTKMKKEKSAKKIITREDIERRAYQIYIESGYVPGRDYENWAQAEKELSKK